MLRSKATAALLKLKEIDRKYKIKSSEDVKLESSLSDISMIDSKDEKSKHSTGSCDKSDGIMNTRTRLDIRMPDTHMERSTAGREYESELVTIFNKANKQSPRLDANDVQEIMNTGKITEEINMGLKNSGEENVHKETLEITSFDNSSLEISEMHVADTETSISEDVPEVVSCSSHPVSNHLEVNFNQEITPKSVDSIIDADKSVRNDLDEDPSTLVASGTYSDDFVKTLSSENGRASNSVVVDKAAVLDPDLTSSKVKCVSSTSPSYQRQQSPELPKHTEPESKDIGDLISAMVLRVDANSDASPRNHVKNIDRSFTEEVKNPPRRLQQKSSKSSSARSSKEHRTRRRPNTSSSHRDSKSPEFSSSFSQKKDPGITDTSVSLNPSKSDRLTGQNSSDRNPSGKDKNLVNPHTVSSLELQNDHREANRVPWSSKDETVAVIRRKKVASKMKKGKSSKIGTRAKDSSIKEPPSNYSKDSKMHKCTSVIQPVPVTMVRPITNFLKFSKDDEAIARRSAVSRGKDRRSNKQKPDDSPCRSRHRTKGVSLGHRKKQTKEEPGLGYEAKDVYRLRQQIKELRLQQDREQLRSRIRGYVQQMMNEQRRLLAHDVEFGGSIDQFDYNATGLRQADSLRSFFKPLDLPNVAAFNRPDFEDDKAANLRDNEKYLNLHTIRDRALGIRHWLKQQFVLYRDYSTLVATINANYIPVTLKETKKMIHDMQQFYSNRERRRHVR